MRLKDRGFTLVELMIVMVIMAILLGLGVASVSGLQAQGRDKERAADIEAIARGLESRYNEGNPNISTTPPGWDSKGMYPGYNEFVYAVEDHDWCDEPTQSPIFQPCQQDNENGNYVTSWLPGTSIDTFYAPENSDHTLDGPRLISLWLKTYPSTETTDLLNSDYYIYQALDANGNPCYDSGCVKFNLYYKEETTGNIITVKSKHQ